MNPIDEADKEPGFADFRGKLLAAVERRDVTFLVKHLDENITYSFGPDEPGPEGFMKAWGLNGDPSGVTSLHDAGLVTAEKKGQFVIYSLNMTVFHEIAAWLLDYRAKGEVDREDKER